MIEIVLIGIISGAVSAATVIGYSKYIQHKRLTKMAYYAQGILEEFEERVINARLEIEDGVIRCYNKDTDEFLAQGKSMDEVNDVLKKRFPDKLFNVRQEQIDRATNLRG
jgi:hypothetical protein